MGDLWRAPLMLGGGDIRDGGFAACSADAGRWSYPGRDSSRAPLLLGGGFIRDGLAGILGWARVVGVSPSGVKRGFVNVPSD